MRGDLRQDRRQAVPQASPSMNHVVEVRPEEARLELLDGKAQISLQVRTPAVGMRVVQEHPIDVHHENLGSHGQSLVSPALRPRLDTLDSAPGERERPKRSTLESGQSRSV